VEVPKEGTSILVDIYRTPTASKDEAFWTKAVRAIATAIRCTTGETLSKRYRPHGLTVLAVISMSHIAVHTWPEHDFVALDVYTCQRLTAEDMARLELVVSALGPQYTISASDRGRALP
jgi:S-adenosylmethionine decarboxylase proenzyme